MLQLTLLGSPQIALDGAAIADKLSNKAQALLFFLAVTGQMHSRDKLAALFWADVSDQHARKNLRDVVVNLRKTLAVYLEITAQTIALNPASYILDVQMLHAGRPHHHAQQPDLAALDATLALYKGPFLNGFYVRNAPNFEEWVLLERQALHEQMVQSALFLVEQAIHQANYRLGLSANRRLLTLEPAAEIAHRQQMRLLAYSGQREAALAQYELCRQALAKELDAEPEIETVELYKQIRQGDLLTPLAKQTEGASIERTATSDGTTQNVRIDLQLLGAFALHRHGQATAQFRSNKVRALLAYLALEGKTPIPRTQLLELFWPCNDRVTARNSLRVALTNLRQLLVPLPLLKATAQTVQFEAQHLHFRCDALVLDQEATSGDSSKIEFETTPFVQREFLPGFDTLDSPAFQTWLQARRTHYARLQQNKHAGGKTLPALPPTVCTAHNLPRQLTPLLGREREIITLRNKLLAPDHHLVTVTGEGGVGKTRLVLAVGETMLSEFPDGVWFVPLVGLMPSPDLTNQLAAAIGEAAHLTFVNATPLSSQLFAQLRTQRMLLILDNFEHLIDGAPFVVDLLRETTNLKVLVASRQRLHLLAEDNLRLDGLPVPDVEEMPMLLGNEQAARQFTSVALFAERARRIYPAFRLKAQNLAAVIHICQLVEGLPLAIELAATRVGNQSCHEIAVAVADNSHWLATSLADVPARHRSMQAVLAASWRLLTWEAADVLARCSVFRGAFTRQAAAFVCGATPMVLGNLENHSLLCQNEQGAYTLHELVRQYAAHQLAVQPMASTTTAQRHCTYYVQFVATQGATLRSQPQTQQLFQQEIDNLRAAWQWACTHNLRTEIERCMDHWAQFLLLAGYYQEGVSRFQMAAALFCAEAPADQRLLAALLLHQAKFTFHLLRLDEVEQLAQLARALAEAQADAALLSDAYSILTQVLYRQGEYPAALAAIKQALASAQQCGRSDLEAACFNQMSLIWMAFADFAQANVCCEAVLPLLQHAPDIGLEMQLYSNLAQIHYRQANFAATLAHSQRAYTLSRVFRDPFSYGFTTLQLGDAYLKVGDYPTARHYYEQALTILNTIEQAYPKAWVRASLGRLWLAYGDYTMAQQECDQAVQICRQGKLGAGLYLSLVYWGDSLRGLQQVDEAIRVYQQAIALAQAAGPSVKTFDAEAALADLLLDRHAAAQAWNLVKPMLAALLDQKPGITEDPLRVYWVCYRVLQANHDPRAHPVLKNGYALLQQQAATIPDPELQRAFLENVAVNRALRQAVETKTWTGCYNPQKRNDARLGLGLSVTY